MKTQCDHFKLGRFRQTGRRIDDCIHAFIYAYNATTKYHFENTAILLTQIYLKNLRPQGEGMELCREMKAVLTVIVVLIKHT